MLLRRARLADGRVADVRVEGERIADVQASITAAPADRVVDLGGELLLLPAPAEPHAHLDKAFLAERIPNERGDLAGAIEAVMSNRHVFSVGDIAERAERAAVTLLANGATAIRTHADVMRGHGLRSVEALVRARERLAGRVELQIVALMGWPVTGAGGAEHRTMLREAIAAGADVVGGCPHLEPEPEAATDTLLTIAAELGCPIDLHTDEQLRPDVLCVRDFAARVTTTGFTDGAVASHCVSLGVQPPAVQAEVAGEVAAAGIAVVTLPQTNLYLQGRDHAVATPRGLTALRPLLDAGVTVAGGADNLQDPFNPIGRADPLETAALLVLAGHLSPDEAYHAVSASARAAMGLPVVTVTPGAPAELMALPASSIRDAIAFAPAPRLVVHRGIVVVEPSTR